jgi:hypothetical protein
MILPNTFMHNAAWADQKWSKSISKDIMEGGDYFHRGNELASTEEVL